MSAPAAADPSLPALPGESQALRRPGGARREGKRGFGGPTRDQLAIRWFTPRGRAAIAALLDELRHGDGRELSALVADLRREGAAPGAPDLRGIDLRGRDLGSARLAGADLRGARLEGATLAQADLRGARLELADLRRARLNGADLSGAALLRADLRDADLREARLEDAGVEGAKLRGARFQRAWVRGVEFELAHTEGAELEGMRREERPVPKPSPRALRDGLGAPPVSEPVPPTQRLRLAPRGATRVPPPPLPGAPALPGALEIPGADLDRALARLLLDRARVGRIVAEIDGREVVLFIRPEARARRAA
ncbi:MAG: pentapeptide repeat-containing protein [Planctomycetota bacterium]